VAISARSETWPRDTTEELLEAIFSVWSLPKQLRARHTIPVWRRVRILPL
jgi:hypothetical protein